MVTGNVRARQVFVSWVQHFRYPRVVMSNVFLNFFGQSLEESFRHHHYPLVAAVYDPRVQVLNQPGGLNLVESQQLVYIAS